MQVRTSLPGPLCFDCGAEHLPTTLSKESAKNVAIRPGRRKKVRSHLGAAGLEENTWHNKRSWKTCPQDKNRCWDWTGRSEDCKEGDPERAIRINALDSLLSGLEAWETGRGHETFSQFRTVRLPYPLCLSQGDIGSYYTSPPFTRDSSRSDLISFAYSSPYRETDNLSH
uniref:Secreted protein n=1 Tax=Steinernema glaseri TaxID=37863 RepID=A0A1I7ZY03_9BILA